MKDMCLFSVNRLFYRCLLIMSLLQVELILKKVIKESHVFTLYVII